MRVGESSEGEGEEHEGRLLGVQWLNGSSATWRLHRWLRPLSLRHSPRRESGRVEAGASPVRRPQRKGYCQMLRAALVVGTCGHGVVKEVYGQVKLGRAALWATTRMPDAHSSLGCLAVGAGCDERWPRVRRVIQVAGPATEFGLSFVPGIARSGVLLGVHANEGRVHRLSRRRVWLGLGAWCMRWMGTRASAGRERWC